MSEDEASSGTPLELGFSADGKSFIGGMPLADFIDPADFTGAAEKTPGQVFRETLHERWSARGQRIDTRAYDALPQADRDDLEAAAQAVLDNRTPWGDANMVTVQQWPKVAIIRSGGPDDDVVKVIVVKDGELAYCDSLAELPAIAEARPQPAPDPRPALDSLARVAENHERVMYAALIQLNRGHVDSARLMLDNQLDGFDAPPWDGTESGAEWLERTREAGQ